MPFTSGFFDAQLTDGAYDRVYAAADFAEYFSKFVGNGVFPNPGSNLTVKENSPQSMSVLVSAGMGWINGYYVKNTADYPLNIQVADGTYGRIDAVVLRWVKTDRSITPAVKTGTPAASPAVPTLTRTADTYEIMLAQVSVPAGVTSVTYSNITDKRPDTSVCGWVTGLIEQYDSSGLFASFESWFQDWFENLQYVLSGDVAGHLQVQIDQLVSDKVNYTDKASKQDVLDGVLQDKFVTPYSIGGKLGKVPLESSSEWLGLTAVPVNSRALIHENTTVLYQKVSPDLRFGFKTERYLTQYTSVIMYDATTGLEISRINHLVNPNATYVQGIFDVDSTHVILGNTNQRVLSAFRYDSGALVFETSVEATEWFAPQAATYNRSTRYWLGVGDISGSSYRVTVYDKVLKQFSWKSTPIKVSDLRGQYAGINENGVGVILSYGGRSSYTDNWWMLSSLTFSSPGVLATTELASVTGLTYADVNAFMQSISLYVEGDNFFTIDLLNKSKVLTKYNLTTGQKLASNPSIAWPIGIVIKEPGYAALTDTLYVHKISLETLASVLTLPRYNIKSAYVPNVMTVGGSGFVTTPVDKLAEMFLLTEPLIISGAQNGTLQKSIPMRAINPYALA